MNLRYYKGQIFDCSDPLSQENDNDDYNYDDIEIYLYSHEDTQYITINIDYETDYDFKFCDKYVYNDENCTHIQHAYREALEIYINNHIDELRKFDKATLDDFVNLIEKTYTPFMESYKTMKKIFEGGSATKSAK